MKHKLRKRTLQLFSLLMVLALTISFMPQMAAPAYAASGAPAIVEGSAGVLAETANTGSAQKVWYADRAWWVISHGDKGNEFAADPSAMTLFSKDVFPLRGPADVVSTFGEIEFMANQPTGYDINEYADDYKNSTLQIYTDGLFDNGAAFSDRAYFSEKEKKPVLLRTLGVEEYIVNEQPYAPPYSNGVSGVETEGYLWPLSTAEAYVLPDAIKYTSNDRDYWLRSPGEKTANYYMATKARKDQYDTTGIEFAVPVIRYHNSVRPAFHMDLDSVLFTSAAVGGKDSTTLAEVGTNATDEWKLTLKDDGTIDGLNGHSGFTVSSDEVYYIPASGEVGISYSGAATGENEYISAIVKDSDGNVTHYGRLRNATESDGAVTFDIDESILEDGTIYLFNEQYNGDKKTDYASALKEVKIPKPINVSVAAGNKDAASDLMEVFGPNVSGIKIKLNEAGDTLLFSIPNFPGDGIKAGDFITLIEDALGFTESNYDGYINKWKVGYREIYESQDEFNADIAANSDKVLESGMTFYVQWERPVRKAEITVDVPKCGYTVTGDSPDSQDPKPTLTNIEGEGINQNPANRYGFWWSEPSVESGEAFAGKVEAGDTLNVRATLETKYGYYFVDQNTIECYINGVKAESVKGTGTSIMFAGALDITEHEWGPWKVTKEPTETAAGTETRECSICHKTETRAVPAKGYAPGADPNQKGSDGTAVGPGASAAAAEKAIISMKSDSDPKGTVFSKLRLKSPKQTKKSVKLSWTKVSKAKKYVIYGNKCGKANKPKKLATVKGNTKTFSKVAGKKIKKGTYYKFIMVALDKNNNVISTSRLIHVATKGGKVGNHKSVTVKKSVLKKARKLRKGKSLSLKAKAVAQSKKLKVQKHVKVRFESTNKKIATVSTKGVVKGKKKGTCYVYAYAQNGVYKKIKVTVK